MDKKKEKLVFFDILKDGVRISPLYKNEAALKEIDEDSPDKSSLTDAEQIYSTPIKYPKPGIKRPYIVSSIVLSADGKMAFADNKAGPLVAKNNYLDPDGALLDFWVLNMIRAYSDGVLFGANTLKNEPGITSHVYDNSLNNQRKTVLGKKHHPIGVAVSLDGTDIPFDHMMFHVDPDEEYKVLIATSPSGREYICKNSTLKHTIYGPFTSLEDVNAWDVPDVYGNYDTFPIIVTGEGSMPDTEVFLAVLGKLKMEMICIESPTYTSMLIKMGCLDEYFINYSMVYAGGNMTPGYNAPESCLQHAHANLLSIGIHKSNFIFTRQKLVYDSKCEESLNKYKY